MTYTPIARVAELAMRSLAVSILLVGGAIAGEPVTAEPVEFNIDKQPMSAALNEFARQSDREILFSTEVVEEIDAPDIAGTFEPEDALGLLLADTGLGYSTTDDDTFLVNTAGDSESGKSNPASGTVVMAQTETSEEKQTVVSRKVTTDGETISRQVEIENIIVTGTRLGIDAEHLAANVFTIDADALSATGQPTLDRALRQLPQAQLGASDVGGIASDEPGLGYNLSGMSTINLRGLGNDSTLILVNGKRIGKHGSTGVATDISMIPVDSVERIEVLMDGASAIYGSDAVGGVVNIVLKKDYTGTHAKLSYGQPANGDFSEYGIQLSSGYGWNTGSIRGYFNRFHTDDLSVAARSDVSYSLSPYPGGLPHIQYQGADYTVPVGFDGDPASLIPGAPEGVPGTQTLIPERTQDSVRIDFDQELGKAVNMSLSVNLSDTETTNVGNSEGTTFSNPNGFFVPGTAPFNSLSPDFVRVHGVQFEDFPSWSSTDVDTTNVVLSFDGDIGSTSWNWELSGGNNKSDLHTKRFNAANISAAAAFGNGWDHDGDAATPPVVYDVLGGTTPDVIAQLLWDPISTSETKNKFVEGLVRGSVMALPAGDITAALGFNTNSDELTTFSETALGVSGITGTATTVDNGGKQKSVSYFVETLIPVFGDNNSLTMLRQLDINASFRNDDYDSAAGEDDTWGVGLVWSPFERVRLRFNRATSFLAPALAQGLLETQYRVRTAAFAGAREYDPDTGALLGFKDLYYILGGNQDLKPETATTTTYGIEITPIDSLMINVTYHDTDYKNRIVKHNAGQWTNFINHPALMALGRANLPAYQGPVDPSTLDLLFGTPIPDFQVDGYVWDRRWKNVGKAVHEGVDSRLDWIFDTETAGEFQISASYALITKYDVFDEFGTPTSWVGDTQAGIQPVSKKSYYVNLGWMKRGFGVGVNINTRSDTSIFLGDFERRVSHPTNVNLTLGYDFAKDGLFGGAGFLEGSHLGLAVSNLTDDDISITNFYFEDSSTEQAPLFYPSLMEARGRMFTLTLSHTF